LGKILAEEKQLLLQLIKSCEYFDLTEKQSIEFINNMLIRTISRRSYYNYKRKLYSHDIFNRLKESIYNSPLCRTSILLLIDDTDFEVRAKVNKLIADQFPSKNLSSLQLQSLDENNENMKGKLDNVLTKIGQFKEMENLSKTGYDALPKNATIREEFIKCGKDTCNLCPHGPYYYAYWRDKTNNSKSKLRKKYLGTTDPRY
jgi:hypothetical protein